MKVVRFGTSVVYRIKKPKEEEDVTVFKILSV